MTKYKEQCKVFNHFLKEAREDGYAGDSTVLEDVNGCLRVSRWTYEDGHEIRYDIILSPDGTWEVSEHEGIM